jgi:MFS family permease
MTPGRIFALSLLAGVFIMEGFDIAAMSIAVPRLEGALELAPESFGWVFTAILIGLGVGGATIAPLGDRYGRRALIVAGCLATGLATLATATAATITEFLIWRLVTGLALGACLPNVSRHSGRPRARRVPRAADYRCHWLAGAVPGARRGGHTARGGLVVHARGRRSGARGG